MKSESGRITLIRIEKKGRMCRLIFSNDHEIPTTPQTVENFGLSEGDSFGSAEFERLRGDLERRYAFYVADSALAGRPYSVGEFRDKLRRKEISPGYIEEIISSYLSQNLLDDYRYAAMRVQTLLEHKPAGRSYLVSYLRNRKVPPEIAEKTVDEALMNESELDIAFRLLRKRLSSFMKFDVDTARRKAYNYLSRRGISYRSAKEAFENLFLRPRD